MTRLSSDWDPSIGLSDGTVISGALLADNNDGEGFAVSFLDSVDVAEVRCDLSCNGRMLRSEFDSAGYPEIGQAVDISLTFEFELTATIIELSYLGSSARFQSQRTLDPTMALSFMLIGDERQRESYQVNTLSFEGISTAPEPTTTALLALGLLSAGFAGKRTQRSQPE
jgi:hypothetical protein